QGDVLGAGMLIAVIADLAAYHGNVRLRLAVPGGDADGVPAPDVPAGGNEACQRIAARFGRERLRRALSGLLHDSALDQLEAIGLGQDPVLHHLVVLIDGQSFRGRAHDPAPPESTTAALLAALLHATKKRRRFRLARVRRRICDSLEFILRRRGGTRVLTVK